MTNIWWVKGEGTAEVRCNLLYRIQCPLDTEGAIAVMEDLATQLQEELPGGVLVATSDLRDEVVRVPMPGVKEPTLAEVKRKRGPRRGTKRKETAAVS